jgi:hypothetical protein
MKAICLGLAIAAAAMTPADAADVYTRPAASAPQRLPLALRTLSPRSAAVLAADACWRGCTGQCAWHFPRCLSVSPLVGCIDFNNACDLACLKQCRLKGGPLVSWTEY